MGDPVNELPAEFSGDLPGGARAAEVYCPGALAVQGPTYAEDPNYAQHLAEDRAVAAWPLIFLVDDASAAAKNVTFLWSTFTRFEPAADTYAAAVQLRRHHPCYTPPIVLDCRMKPGYPDELITDEENGAKGQPALAGVLSPRRRGRRGRPTRLHWIFPVGLTLSRGRFMDDTLAFAPIAELATLIRRGELSPLELTELYLERIEQYNPELNAYLAVTAERGARAQARAAEAQIASGTYLGPLHGIPLAFKDLVDVAEPAHYWRLDPAARQHRRSRRHHCPPPLRRRSRALGQDPPRGIRFWRHRRQPSLRHPSQPLGS